MAIVATFNGGVVAAAADDDPTRDPVDDVRLSCCCEASPGPEDEDEGGCLEVIVSEIDTKEWRWQSAIPTSNSFTETRRREILYVNFVRLGFIRAAAVTLALAASVSRRVWLVDFVGLRRLVACVRL